MTATPTANTIPGGFDPALIQRMIDEGVFIETAAGLMAAEVPEVPVPCQSKRVTNH
jgi:hypothetical protein